MCGLLAWVLIGCTTLETLPEETGEKDTDIEDTDTGEEDTDTDEEDTDTDEGDTDTGGEDTGDEDTGGSTDERPCGDALWAWAWAGEDGEHAHIMTVGGYKVISRLNDLSGNMNHFFGSYSNPPPYQVGYSWNDVYSTPLPVISLDRWADGKQSYGSVMRLPSHINASGPFYLAFAGMNTRTGGAREVWGAGENHFVRLDQERDRVELEIDGEHALITGKQAVEKGPLLLEVWRDETDRVFVVANGVDVSQPVSLSGTFKMNGTGYDGKGSSQWDDVSFEYIACKGEMTESSRSQVRAYLNDKWHLY